MEIKKFFEATHIDEETEARQNQISSLKFAEQIHTHDFYEFFLVTDGRAIHIVNGERQQLTEGTLVFVRPDDVHYYEYDGSSDCSFINVPFRKKAVLAAFDYLGEAFRPQRLLEPAASPLAALTSIEKDHLLGRLERIYVAPGSDKAGTRLQNRALLVEILTRYFGIHVSHESKVMPLWLENLYMQMQKKDNFALGLSRMYELSGRSAGHVSKALKQYSGLTPTAYINRLRLDYARNLILTTDLSITDISMEAGFGNLSHFYHQFVKCFKTAPADLRRQV